MSRAAAFRIWSRVAAPFVLFVSAATAVTLAIGSLRLVFTDQLVQKDIGEILPCQFLVDSQVISGSYVGAGLAWPGSESSLSKSAVRS